MRHDGTIVLVHGLNIVRDAVNTFLGVPELLTEHGFRVHRTCVQGDGPLDELAERVWAQLDSLEGPLTLLCHSMGGLQARTFLLREERARRLQAICTVGSPHGGSPFARLMSAFNQAYRDMTPEAREHWNNAHGEAEQSTAQRLGIQCLSVVAALQGPPGYSRLRLAQEYLEHTIGPSDGLVPAASQRWGEVAFEVDLDHMECACVNPPSKRASESRQLWLRMAEVATGSSSSHANAVGVE